jgi:hypothetical protein
VVLDPDVYPMDPAWLTGKSTRIRRKRHDDVELPKIPAGQVTPSGD